MNWLETAEICDYRSAEALYNEVADRILELIDKALCEKDQASLVLGGGKTPPSIHKALLSCRRAKAIYWPHVSFWQSDERCVPYGTPENNGRMIYETLCEPLGVPDGNFHRIPVDLGPKKAATAYECQLETYFNGDIDKQFDLSVLGFGPDGHIASLFPGNKKAIESNRLVARGGIGPNGIERITLTPRAICRSKAVFLLVNGSKKSATLEQVLDKAYNPVKIPLHSLSPISKQITIFHYAPNISGANDGQDLE